MADQSREGALRSLLDYTGYGPPPLRTVVRRALESGDVALCRTLVLTPLSRIDRAEVAAILDRLHAADALDAQVVQHAYTVDVHLVMTSSVCLCRAGRPSPERRVSRRSGRIWTSWCGG